MFVYAMPANPRELFDKHYLEWADDFRQQAEHNGVTLNDAQLKTLILSDIKNRLQSWERTLKSFGLHEPTEAEMEQADFSKTNTIPALIREELNFDIAELTQFVHQKKSCLNTFQVI